jgi:hypothetical protein
MTPTGIIAFTSIAFLSLAAATPVRAQAATSGGPADTGAHHAAAVPDFSGIWAHPFFPGFELPLSGAGPVTNRSQQTQIFDVDGRLRPTRDGPIACPGWLAATALRLSRKNSIIAALTSDALLMVQPRA